MIEKICKIINIGKFEKHSSRGDTTLKKFTALFSGNGLGKTTLADIFRSLSTDDAEIIAGRKTLGAPGESEAKLLVGGNSHQYKDGKWNQTVDNISIYDSGFVFENVYGGNVVDHTHKRNLFRVIVGKKGVTLAKEIDGLDNQIRNIGSETKTVKQYLLGAFGSEFDIDKILTSETPENVDNLIEEKAKEVRAGEQKTEIISKSFPKKLKPPALPSSFESVLRASIDDVSESAEKEVEEHIKKHSGKLSEQWIARGLETESNQECPFCGQSTARVSLVESYKTVFGNKFKALKTEIETISKSVKSIDPNTLPTQKRLNDELLSYWKQFLSISELELNIDSIQDELVAHLKIARTLIKKKAENPLESISTSEEFRASLNSLQEFKKTIEGYNLALEATEKDIRKLKESGGESKLPELKSQIAWLNALKQKTDKKIAEAFNKYHGFLKQKKKLDKEKKDKKTELEKHTESIFPVYQQKINEYLDNFDAGFSIIKTQGSFAGGRPSSNYQLVIKNIAFDLGDAKSPKNIASFKNTLSSGDKSTLALAFFMAGLDLEKGAENRIVIFDDPITSQDRFRRSYTKQLILRECRRSKQVILLSHDDNFIKTVWDKVKKEVRKTLQIVRTAGSSSIIDWDIESESKSIPNQDHDTLVEYVRFGNENKIPVVRSIRPWIEAWLRQRYMGEFSGDDSLGKMIPKIKAATDENKLFDLQGSIDELNDINEFSTEYQHGEDAAKIKQTLDDGELKAYAKRALKFTGSI